MTDPHTGLAYLATPHWLYERLEDPTVRVVDTRNQALFDAGHIPGAVFVDVRGLDVTDTSPAGIRGWVGRLEQAFSAAGITADQQVVFYEEISGEIATRGVWVLTYLGHDGARLLDGGLNAWCDAGYTLTRGPSPVAPTSFRARPRPELVATRDGVLRGLGDPNVRLLDVRRATEYGGAEVRAQRGGRLPGAVHLEWLHNLAEDGHYQDLAALATLYAHADVQPHHEVIPYCQGGYRSANTWLALMRLGYPRVRNYVGGREEWGNLLATPIEDESRVTPC